MRTATSPLLLSLTFPDPLWSQVPITNRGRFAVPHGFQTGAPPGLDARDLATQLSASWDKTCKMCWE